MLFLELEGAAKLAENRRAEIWFTAMLQRMDKPPSLQEFTTGEKDIRAEMVRCVEAWDKVDRALAASKAAGR